MGTSFIKKKNFHKKPKLPETEYTKLKQRTYAQDPTYRHKYIFTRNTRTVTIPAEPPKHQNSSFARRHHTHAHTHTHTHNLRKCAFETHNLFHFWNIGVIYIH